MSKRIVALLALVLAGGMAFGAAPNIIGPGVSPMTVPSTPGPYHPGINAWGGGMSDPKSGDYWWFDQAQPTWPHPGDPTPSPMHPSWQEITTQSGVQKYKSAGIPLAWQLKDSIWYYGVWYLPTANYLYISPDGWISFTSGTTPYPFPHVSFPDAAAPNALLAPMWADWNPLGGAGSPEPNAIYYFYNATSKTLLVEWYRVTEPSKTTQFTFQTWIQFGGKDRYYSSLNFSYHFIDFLYHSSFPTYNASTWPAQYLTGIENHAGTYGLSSSSDDLTYKVGPNYALRYYYRKVYRYDVMAWDIMSPGSIVLRYTKIEPKVVVANVGQEIADFALTFTIDSGSKNVYSATRTEDGLYPAGNPGGLKYRDTIVFPCWDRPADIGARYKLTLTTAYALDQNAANNTYTKNTVVGCDDALGWPWGYRVDGWGISPGYSGYRFATGYNAAGGAIVTGARGEFYPGAPLPGVWQLEVWGSNAGCGLPVNVNDGKMGESADQPGNQSGWSPWVTFTPPIWAPSANPGNIWIAWQPTDNSNPSGYLSNWSFYTNPGFNNCFNTSKPTPWTVSATSTSNGSSWTWGADPYSYGEADAWALEAQTHLGLMVPPAPPCYSGVGRDLIMLDYWEPDLDGYVEALAPITPKATITNWGKQTEPGSGFFYVIFTADSAGTLVYNDSTAIPKIGWLGDPTDNPDSIKVSTPIWTPGDGGYWDGTKHIETTYNTTFIVKLGKIGPDKSDHCPYNDTLYKDITSLWTHDVGVIAIPKPDKNYSVQGDPVPVVGLYQNFGINNESNIPVETKVYDKDNVLVYANSGLVPTLYWRADPTHLPDTASYTFAPWNSTAGKAFGQFKLEVWSKLVGDQDATDDVMSMAYYIVYNKNMAALAITDEIPKATMPFTPKGTFQNQGASTESGVNVTFKVLYGGGEVFTDSKSIATLDPVATTEVEFGQWTPAATLENHEVTLHIETPGGDDNPADDVFEKKVIIASGVEEPITKHIPTTYYLAAAHPTPFTTTTTIEFGLPTSSNVKLSVYDVTGKLVKTLANSRMEAGVYTPTWNGTNNAGRSVAQGIYLVYLDTPTYKATKKLILVTH